MLIEIVLPVILAVIMFSLGLGLRPADFWLVFVQPRGFAIGAFNQMIVVPVTAFVLAKLFGLNGEMALGLMILAACPGGVLSNAASQFAGGNVALSISLTAVISLVSVITLPLVVAASAAHFLGAEAASIHVATLGGKVFVLTAVPVGLGMALRRFSPRLVRKSSPWISRLAFLLFLLLIVAALVANWDAFASNLRTLGPALVSLNALLLAIGLASASLAGLKPMDATSIAIESGTQNGALAIAVGLMVVGADGGLPATTLPAVVYSITAWLLTLPFVLWRRGQSRTPRTSNVSGTVS
ncbi:bile acid:sodium symporter family protein [Jiella marina]|uniref:bile acid:sodium symporter family protein n=1 Tax=Jiella sp. LLJ827 TaxID=2917712 RepID=UPI002100ACE7|nr:bile acid:sodium symporter [Jiella sp. LLJ827]MCQ0988716.1 bile acid:sodium symporter [Jiella sp. LLJ827]